jgi:thioredoxin 1
MVEDNAQLLVLGHFDVGYRHNSDFSSFTVSCKQPGPLPATPHTYIGASPMSEHVHYISDDSFEQEVLQAGVPVLVDYWADWCGPCKMISPILDEIAKEYAGKLKVCKLNIDENQATPPKFGIRGIPTLMIFKNGNVEATKVGALSKSQLTAFVDSNI